MSWKIVWPSRPVESERALDHSWLIVEGLGGAARRLTASTSLEGTRVVSKSQEGITFSAALVLAD